MAVIGVERDVIAGYDAERHAHVAFNHVSGVGPVRTDHLIAHFGSLAEAWAAAPGQIRRVLDERPAHRATAIRFRDELEDFMSPDYADETLSTAITWGRYAELYSYDEEADQFYLEEE